MSKGYKVTRTNEREGKTHKVTGPDGTVKYFGDPDLKNRPDNKEAKAAFYARHADSLKNNPHFRAYARSTWAEGGYVEPEGAEVAVDPSGLKTKKEELYTSGTPAAGGSSEPAIDTIAKTGLPMVAGAIGGAYGGPLGSAIASTAAKMLMNNLAEGGVAGNNVGSMASLINAIGKQQYIPFPEINDMSDPSGNVVPMKKIEGYADGDIVGGGSDVGDIVDVDASTENPVSAPPAEPTAIADTANVADEADPGKSNKRKPLGEDEEGAKKRKRLDELEREIDKLPVAEGRAADRDIIRASLRDIVLDKASDVSALDAKYSELKSRFAAAPQPVAAAPQPVKVETGDAVVKVEPKTESVAPKPVPAGPADLMSEGVKDPRYMDLFDKALRMLGGEIVGEEALTNERRARAHEIAKRMMKFETGSIPPPPARGDGSGGETGDTTGGGATTDAGGATTPAAGPAVTVTPEAQAKELTTSPLSQTAPAKLEAPKPVPPVPETAAPAPAPFNTLSAADQDKAIRAHPNFALVKSTMDAVGLGGISENTALEETRNFLLAGGEQPLPSQEEIQRRVLARPEVAAYAEAASAEAKSRLEMAQLDELERLASADLRNQMQDLQIAQAKDLQMRLMAVQAQADALRSSAVNDVMTAKLQTGVPPFAALFGVIGAGLGGTGSVADFVKERATAELNAQLAIMDRKRTLLGDLMAQGKSLPEAYAAADALIVGTYATMIERQLPGIRDAQARAKASFDAAKLRREVFQKLTEDATTANRLMFDQAKAKVDEAEKNVKPAIEYIKVMADLKKAEEARKNAEKVARIRAAGDIKAAAVKLEDTDKPLSPSLYALRSGKGVNTADWIRATGKDKDYVGRDAPGFSIAPDGTAKFDTTQHFLAKSADAAKELQTVDKRIGLVLKDIKEIDDIGKSVGYGTVLDRAKSARVEVLRSRIIATLAKEFDLGVLQESDRKALQDVITGFQTLSTAAYNKASIDQLRTLFQQGAQATRATLLEGGGAGGMWSGKDERPAGYVEESGRSTKPAYPSPTSGDISKLKADPSPKNKKFFDDIYGPGAADAAVKGKI